jgi:Tfp pilus assembly protein PilF
MSQTSAPRVQAQAWEYLALAYHGLQYPASEVDEAYQRAIELAPENPRRKQNYDAIRASMLGIGDAP